MELLQTILCYYNNFLLISTKINSQSKFLNINNSTISLPHLLLKHKNILNNNKTHSIKFTINVVFHIMVQAIIALMFLQMDI